MFPVGLPLFPVCSQYVPSCKSMNLNNVPSVPSILKGYSQK